tara:strand:+ start:595 stop:1008 length:414 start_codon:yes stop_codon:yes gene_type:complete
MSIEDKVENYKKTLELFPNDQEKYQYLIEQAKESTEFPEELRQDSFKVHGCQSQVWLVPEQKEEKLHFLSDSDALISKGLVTLIASIYSDETAEEIANSEIDLMEEFNLGVILSPARRNGAYSMLKTIKEYAKNLIS